MNRIMRTVWLIIAILNGAMAVNVAGESGYEFWIHLSLLVILIIWREILFKEEK